MLGIVVVIVVVLAIAAGADVGGSSSEPSTAASWIKLVLGVLLLAVGVRQWRRRPKGDEPVSLPKWMAAIDDVTPVKAVGLGFLLSAVNPKNLLMCIAAGVTIAGGGLDTGQEVIATAVFVVIAVSTVVVPVLGYALAKERMAAPARRAQGLAATEQRNGHGRAGPGDRGHLDRQGHRRSVVRGLSSGFWPRTPDVPRDLAAGVTVAMVSVAEGMAYAVVAGVDPL